mmetsp:Transcript_148073/g.258303  ORF Transcript_148073/g.258303 Transcript_148073/m.258303 type:complete len:232 (-) Transcript_148073:1063-1758(-)
METSRVLPVMQPIRPHNQVTAVDISCSPLVVTTCITIVEQCVFLKMRANPSVVDGYRMTAALASLDQGVECKIVSFDHCICCHVEQCTETEFEGAVLHRNIFAFVSTGPFCCDEINRARCIQKPTLFNVEVIVVSFLRSGSCEACAQELQATQSKVTHNPVRGSLDCCISGFDYASHFWSNRRITDNNLLQIFNEPKGWQAFWVQGCCCRRCLSGDLYANVIFTDFSWPCH